ncbi:Ecm13p SKDI_02G0630 [Saccharomyces kudriavzevii IFO 1802]|uniref:ECM13-like protein n=2 Tax=Saccharomyces kudriavzevii (strain ATCC MYA-4449 / AS 2.2408 / CBS 8840 / NBRC 1802 / NCYC 2889) TaxID=226230 RepID=J6ED39_SACK1|nr:uncharacterized protein SKDI_02G0630 [Saccharomyces kudriavzevii IFO 1802]EJT42184.1 ECM13-like protein [Saccharomyces kudriavzevii IFO 1802]CAI4054980.1 hypothetical protein SKDI_02G0630 [Saccharomyces kudriavzevii IFO 1802]
MNSTYSSIEDQYVLAGKARSKLAKCIDVNSRNKDYNLRVLVGHANLLDKITENVEAHKSAANPLTKNLFSRGHENLSMEHIELSNARNNSSIDEENTRKADCVDYCEDYCDFYSSDEDPDADTLSSTDSEGDDDYEDYDFDYDYSCGDHNKKIDTYFGLHTTLDYHHLGHTNSHSEQADELSQTTPRYNALPAAVPTAWEEHEDDDARKHDSTSLYGAMPIFRVLSRQRTVHDGDSSTGESDCASDTEDGSVPLTRFHSCPITA